jgi:anaerobic ribonucleoside-triphosphate reductase activating protein
MVKHKQLSLAIGGIVPFSTIDYPEHLSTVLFCQGCTFKCHYCHNPDLIKNNRPVKYHWNNIYEFLAKRKNFLEAVVFSGGEPTLQKDLPTAINVIKQMGYKIALHTAGPFPSMLEKILPSLDWIGMDVKAPFSQYEQITTIPHSGKNILTSIKMILANKIPHEFRTTIHPKLLTNEQILQIAAELKHLGVTTYTLQRFRAIGCINKSLSSNLTLHFPEQKLIQEIAKQFTKFTIV